MPFIQFTLGTTLQIQYKVVTLNKAPELIWYTGRIIALQAICDNTARVTVNFEGTESFDECEEVFIAENNGSFVQDGKTFPHRLVINDRVGTFDNNESTQDNADGENPRRLMDRLSSMENRLTQLEQQSTLQSQSIPSLYMSLCCVLNKSLKRYKNRKHKLQTTSEELSTETWVVTQTCTYSDFKVFLQYLRTLADGLEVSGDEDQRLASPRTTISFSSFKQFCNLFSISEYNYHGLLSCYKSNKKGQLVSFKTVGTAFESTDAPSLPSILCLGGNVQNWCDENVYFSRENSHTLSTGGYACEYDHLSTRQSYVSRHTSVRDFLTCNNLSATWSIDDTTDICRPVQNGSHFIGKLVIKIPYLVFKNARLATKIHKWVRPNRNFSDSSDSSSSSY